MILLSAISARRPMIASSGMVVLGIGVGLFDSSVTTAAITALDPLEAGLAGAVVYMFQIAGDSIDRSASALINTAMVISARSMPAGIHRAFLVDGALAIASAAVALLFCRRHSGR